MTRASTHAHGAFTLVLGLFAAVGPAAAQPAGPPQEEQATLAPIECRARTSLRAVRVGEPFTLTITCAVVETASTTVVADRSRLDPAALQAPPFDVTGGAASPDRRTGTHRIFQYVYELRFVGEQIGADLALPGPTIDYRVQTHVNGNTVDGRDQRYQLPSLPMRIVAQVPTAARDIQDPPGDTFAALDERRFHAGLARIAGWALLAAGSLVAFWAMLTIVVPDRQRRRAGAPGVLPIPTVLRAALRELHAIGRERARGGWTDALAARALAALRLAAAVGAGRALAQRPAAGATAAAGELLVGGWWPRRTVLASGAAGAPRRLPGTPAAAGGALDTDAAADAVTQAIAQLSTVVYGRRGAHGANDAAAGLDEALALATDGVRAIARRHAWPARARRAGAAWLRGRWRR